MGTFEACSILLFRDVISSCNLGQASHVSISLDSDFGVIDTLDLGDYFIRIANCSFFKDACSFLKSSKSPLIFKILASNLLMVLF